MFGLMKSSDDGQSMDDDSGGRLFGEPSGSTELPAAAAKSRLFRAEEDDGLSGAEALTPPEAPGQGERTTGAGRRNRLGEIVGEREQY